MHTFIPEDKGINAILTDCFYLKTKVISLLKSCKFSVPYQPYFRLKVLLIYLLGRCPALYLFLKQKEYV